MMFPPLAFLLNHSARYQPVHQVSTGRLTDMRPTPTMRPAGRAMRIGLTLGVPWSEALSEGNRHQFEDVDSEVTQTLAEEGVAVSERHRTGHVVCLDDRVAG